MPEKEIYTHVFPNRFRVVYQKSELSIPLTSMYAFCSVGSAYETDPVRGASHFVEHMCFKGTHKITKARDLLREYDKIGAYFNAYTEKGYTAYMVKCDDQYVQHSVVLLGDMIMNSMFPRKEFNKEQHVVVEESIRSKDDDEYTLEKKLDAIYLNGSSYAYPIDDIDYHPTPDHLKYEDVLKWYHWFYHPSNMVLSIVSNLSFSQIMTMIRKTDFVKKDRNIKDKKPDFALSHPELCILPIHEKNQDKIRVEFLQKTGVSADIIHIGFRTCSFLSEDKYILKLLAHILNGLSGKLFTALRTKHGLTYRSVCENTFYENTGHISIHIQSDPKKIIEDQHHHIGVLPIVIQLLNDLKRNGVSTEEIEVAKGNMKGKYLLNMQSIDNITEYNGIQYMYNRKSLSSYTDSENKKEFEGKVDDFLPFQQLYDKKIKHITKKQMNDIIQHYFSRKNMLIGIMYDKDIPKPKIESICHRFH